MRRTSAGSNLLVLPIDIPAALNGTRVRINSARYCYEAAAGAALTLFQVSMYRWNANGTVSFLGAPNDGTSRTDAACRTLNLSTTSELTGTEHIAVLVSINWTVANTDFELGSVTLNMQPVATGATVASAPSAPPAADVAVVGSE